MRVSTKDSAEVQKGIVLMRQACFHFQEQFSDSTLLVRKLNRNLTCHFQRGKCTNQGS